MKKMCAKCGGATKMKMAKGGSTKPFAAGIPYATGAGQTDGKNGMMKKGGMVKKYQKGGGIEDPKDPKKVSAIQSPAQTLGAMSGKDYRQIKKGVKREQKLARIGSGQQGERVDNLIRTGAGIAESAARIADAAAQMKNKKGGSVKKYQIGGSNPPLASTTPGQIGKGMMKKGGAKKMATGGSLKPVPSNKVGLAKLPTAVRNKMGYQKKGGPIKKK